MTILQVVLAILICVAAYCVEASPTIPAPVPLVASNGTIRSPWDDDQQNTRVDGGTTRYFADNGSDSCGSCTSMSCPCQSLSKMYSVRRSRDNILFKRGDSWTGTLQLQSSPNGTSSDYTTYGVWGTTSEPRPVFDGNGSSQNMRARSYIWVDRLDFRDHSTIRVQEQSHHMTFSYVVNHDNRHTCFAIDQRPNGAGVPHHVTIANSNVGRCGVSALPCAGTTNGHEGFYLSSSTRIGFGAEDIHIYNTRIWGTTKEPINIKEESKRITFQANMIEDVAMCDDLGMVNFNFTPLERILVFGNIIRNVFKHTGAADVFIMGPNGRVYNNLVYNIGQNVNLLSITDIAQGTTKVLHNTFFNWDESIFGMRHNSADNNDILNNIGPGTLSQNINSSSRLFINPSAGDFRLAEGSAAVDRYSNCQGVTRDFQGDTRPINSRCDAGADEQR
jgi:hypothetical protein